MQYEEPDMSLAIDRTETLTVRRSGKLGAAAAAVALAASVLSAPSASLAAGALAIDRNQGNQYGWAIQYRTQSEADRRALNGCGSGCSLVMRFSNTCAAYAADQQHDSTAYGWAWGGRSASAIQNQALQECRRRGGAQSNCVVRVWGCE